MTETRETKIRERVEELTPGLNHVRYGERYEDGDTQLAWTLYLAGGEDRLEEAALAIMRIGLRGDAAALAVKALRSLSSKKDLA